tara:strand:+ start:893 stop:1042 length:150 start_codon:yes stop_codon:yes gene_type:complete
MKFDNNKEISETKTTDGIIAIENKKICFQLIKKLGDNLINRVIEMKNCK